MNVALIADTHGEIDEGVKRALCDAAPDAIVHAGDVMASDVLEILRAIQPRVVAVAGNNDTPRKWRGPVVDLEALPRVAELALPGGVLVVVHGDRVVPARERHQRLRAKFPDARAIVYGHSHRRAIDQELNPWVLNPGVAGRKRAYDGPGGLLLRTTQTRWSVRPLSVR